MTISGKTGLITGALAGLWVILEYLLGIHTSEYAQYSSFIGLIIFFTGIFLSIQRTRDKELGGFIDFKFAFKSGLKTATVAASIWAVFTLIYYQVINPEFIKEANPKVTEEELERASSIGYQVQILVFFMAFTIMMGAIFSLIASAMLKKERVD